MSDAPLTTGDIAVLVACADRNGARAPIAALERAGFTPRCTVVSAVDEFRSALAGNTFDVVISDHVPHEWNALDALAEVRQRTPGVPFIVLSDVLGEERVVQFVKRGAADCILKRHIERLPVAVQRELDDRRARDQLAQATARTSELAARAQDDARRFAEMADGVGEVFFVVDGQFRKFLYVNKAYETVWGRTVESLYEDPRSFLNAVASEHRQAMTNALATVRDGRPASAEFSVIRPDGSVRFLLGRFTPMVNAQGGLHHSSGVLVDLTEERNARLALVDSEARFRKLADASFDAVCVSRDGLLVEVNRGFLDTFGYQTESEVIGRAPSDFAAEESREAVNRAVVSGFEGVYSMVGERKDGARVFLEVTARMHVVDGRPTRITAIRNITQHRALEDQFRHAQKMEAVGRLAGGVAHDFNNLLTVINSYTQLLADDLGPNDPRRNELQEIERAAEGAATLTRQLLAFSRQEVIQPRRLALQDVARSATKILTRLIGEDIKLETVLSPEPLTVEIDPGQFEQVIMNLAINSRDAMPKGGTLTVETAAVEFDEAYVRAHWPATAGHYAMLAVSDTGAGMPDDVRARIFEPFFTTKERGKGTGLGLATVYGIVKNAGGFIWVYSEVGKGSTFKVYLPLIDAEPTVLEAHVGHAPVQRGHETILLVEDSPAVRVAVRSALERLGYTVIEASSGREALKIAVENAQRIHAVLTDVVMPEMSGRELADRLAAMHKGARVLFMSGYTDDAVLRHGLVQPGVAFLQKPFRSDVLAKKLRELLDT